MKPLSCPFLEIALMRLVYPLRGIRLEVPTLSTARLDQKILGSFGPQKCSFAPFTMNRANGRTANGKREESDGFKPENDTYKSY